MKKLLKKSGFTLVEIIVAFAVFAVMAAMIMMMVQLAISAKHQNNIIVENMEYQQGYLVENVKQSEFSNSGTVGQYSFEFTDGNKVSIDYSVVGAPKISDADRPEMSDSTLGTIRYFVPNVDADSTKNNDPDAKKETGQTQSSRYDTRITGTKGFDSVTIMNATKDTSYTVAGQSRYLFRIYVDPTHVDPISMQYAQLNLYFRDNSKSDQKVVGTQTFSQKRAPVPTILEVGYVNDSGLSTSAISTTRNKNVNNYVVTALPRSGGVQIGYDYSDSSSVRSFSSKNVTITYTYHGPANQYYCPTERYCSQCNQFVDSSIAVGGDCNVDWCKAAGKVRATRTATTNETTITNGGFAYFYVVFEGDPNLTTASFGEGTADGYGGYEYVADTANAKGNNEPNIYGAYYLDLKEEETGETE